MDSCQDRRLRIAAAQFALLVMRLAARSHFSITAAAFFLAFSADRDQRICRFHTRAAAVGYSLAWLNSPEAWHSHRRFFASRCSLRDDRHARAIFLSTCRMVSTSVTALRIRAHRTASCLRLVDCRPGRLVAPKRLARALRKL